MNTSLPPGDRTIRGAVKSGLPGPRRSQVCSPGAEAQSSLLPGPRRSQVWSPRAEAQSSLVSRAEAQSSLLSRAPGGLINVPDVAVYLSSLKKAHGG